MNGALLAAPGLRIAPAWPTRDIEPHRSGWIAFSESTGAPGGAPDVLRAAIRDAWRAKSRGHRDA